MAKRLAMVISLMVVLLVSSCTPKVEEVISVVSTPSVTEKRVSFYGAGDNLIHNCLYWQADRHAPGEAYDFTHMYQMVAEDIASADIAYLNQETILGGTELGLSSYPMFNSPQEVGRDMISLGFDVFSHATNHAFDKGEAGLRNTYQFYQGKDVLMVGIYNRQEDRIRVLEKNGIKIAFLNYTYSTNGLSIPDSSLYYAPIAEEEMMVSDIQEASKVADFVVCLLHWGEENQSTPNQLQKEHAKLLSEAGCDVIVGTHSHCIQPVEFVGDTLVVYSLGNYISAQNGPKNMVGGTIRFELVLKGTEKSIENVSFQPVITQYEAGYSNIRVIPFSKYTPELARIHGAGITYEYFEKLIAENESLSQY